MVRSLYALKHWYTRRLGFLIQGSVRRGISPDAWTAAGVLAAAAGCGAIIMGWWPLALILLAARLAGANLDGAVARARGVARPFGYVLNELGDRASDLLIMAGLVGLATRTQADGAQPGALTLTLVATTAATLPTFISLAAAGAGAPRLNGGPLGKTERCLAAVIACALPQHLGIIAWVIIVGSLLTAALRLVRTARSLAGRTGPAPADRVAPPPPEDIARIGRGAQGPRGPQGAGR
nr:CDP-alcohol phosphatidyltransferase family protein [Actinomyces bowdenii]